MNLPAVDARAERDNGMRGRRLRAEWEADSEAAKVKRDGAKDRARKAARDGNAFDNMELVAAEIPEEPKPPRLIVNVARCPHCATCCAPILKACWC